jgi:hypothetical protein
MFLGTEEVSCSKARNKARRRAVTRTRTTGQRTRSSQFTTTTRDDRALLWLATCPLLVSRSGNRTDPARSRQKELLGRDPIQHPSAVGVPQKQIQIGSRSFLQSLCSKTYKNCSVLTSEGIQLRTDWTLMPPSESSFQPKSFFYSQDAQKTKPNLGSIQRMRGVYLLREAAFCCVPLKESRWWWMMMLKTECCATLMKLSRVSEYVSHKLSWI